MSALATLRPPAYTLSAVLASVHGATFTRTASGELRTRCPWHDDHRPSLRVNDAKGVAFCDACGAGGNAYAVLLPVLGSSSAVAAFGSVPSSGGN
jgi:DNA primase